MQLTVAALADVLLEQSAWAAFAVSAKLLDAEVKSIKRTIVLCISR